MSKLNLGNDLYLKGRIGWRGLSKDEYLEKSDYRIINATSLEDKYINWDICGYINRERYDESPEIQLQENDILISKDGTLGKIGFVKNLNQLSTVASGVFVLRNTFKNKLDTDYLFHLLKSNIFKDFISKRKASGSTINHLYQSDLSQFEIELPKIEIQQQVSKLLNVIDDKITLNNRINRELEQMAKLLYDYWFVQFDFPDANGKPYKSSGGKMVWNKELKREIPERWEDVKLKSILKLNYQSISKLDSFASINYLDTSSLNRNVIDSTQLINCNDDIMPSRAQRIICKNDILYSTVRPNQCHYGIIKEPIENMIASTGFAQLHSKVSTLSNDFIYTFLTSNWVIQRLQQIAELSVSSYPSILPSDILDLTIALPKDKNIETMKSINCKLASYYSLISKNNKQNHHLTTLRDWLLPMLMNGQVRVGEAGKKEYQPNEVEMDLAAESGD